MAKLYVSTFINNSVNIERILNIPLLNLNVSNKSNGNVSKNDLIFDIAQ